MHRNRCDACVLESMRCPRAGVPRAWAGRLWAEPNDGGAHGAQPHDGGPQHDGRPRRARRYTGNGLHGQWWRDGDADGGAHDGGARNGWHADTLHHARCVQNPLAISSGTVALKGSTLCLWSVGGGVGSIASMYSLKSSLDDEA